MKKMYCPKCKEELKYSKKTYLLDSGFYNLWYCLDCDMCFLIIDYNDKKEIVKKDGYYNNLDEYIENRIKQRKEVKK